MKKRILFIFSGILAALVIVASAAMQSYPKPQIASNIGKPAPDFVLADSVGQDFKLSHERGKNVVLLFYRGYW